MQKMIETPGSLILLECLQAKIQISLQFRNDACWTHADSLTAGLSLNLTGLSPGPITARAPSGRTQPLFSQNHAATARLLLLPLGD